jgi:hypothetical protein
VVGLFSSDHRDLCLTLGKLCDWNSAFGFPGGIYRKDDYMRIIMIAGALLAGLSGAQAQTAGDWVLARWKNGQHWFPGIIQSVSGSRLTIKYDDGDLETLNVNAVRPYNWAIGSRVECNFKGTGWFAGKITALSGEALSIAYDDGDKEKTRTKSCRSN